MILYRETLRPVSGEPLKKEVDELMAKPPEDLTIVSHYGWTFYYDAFGNDLIVDEAETMGWAFVAGDLSKGIDIFKSLISIVSEVLEQISFEPTGGQSFSSELAIRKLDSAEESDLRSMMSNDNFKFEHPFYTCNGKVFTRKGRSFLCHNTAGCVWEIYGDVENCVNELYELTRSGAWGVE